MKRKKITQYICQKCGALHRKWEGKCNDCNTWNSITEEQSSIKSNSNKTSGTINICDLSDKIPNTERITIGLSEIDRVLGGGLVIGSVTLIGGNPGIGKSTMLLQIAALLSQHNKNCLYITGEESVHQVGLRAKRLGITNKISVANTTSLNEIINTIDVPNFTDVLIIDSIQTIYDENLESAPGTVTQVRECSFELIRIAKQRNICLILIGHVTKEGNIAGPKVLEHMVDTVLYFEGERSDQYRLIRSIKNRFGAANEIGIFEMLNSGLKQVLNPSEIFLSSHTHDVSGACVFAGVEANRAILVEIQALVVPSFLATPRRAVVGWDANRLAMIIAVLNARYQMNLLDKEVYLNVASGFKISEPGADLAVAAALISATKNYPISKDTIFFGEIGLSGEVRKVVHLDARLKEAEKLGFKKAVVPQFKNKNACNIELFHVKYLKDIKEFFEG